MFQFDIQYHSEWTFESSKIQTIISMNYCWLIAVLVMTVSVRKSESLSCHDRQPQPNDEMRLKYDLFCNYDMSLLPGDVKSPTNITVRLNVKDFDYDDSNIMRINSWLTLSWNDKRLAWNAGSYGNIKSINMRVNYLWTPDIIVVNDHTLTSSNCHVTDCLIASTSRVACVMPCSHEAYCDELGKVNWPFDVQNCTFYFRSSSRFNDDISYISDKVTLFTKRTKQNNQWKLIDSSSRSGQSTVSYVAFSFLIERHNGFDQVATVGCAIALIVSNLIALLIEPIAPIRLVVLGVNILANDYALDYLLSLLENFGDNMPKVFSFFDDMMICAVLLLLETIILRGILMISEKPPAWLASVIEKFEKIPFLGLLLVGDSASKKTPENVEELVENVKEQSTDQAIVQNFVRLADRLFLILTSVVFPVMILALFPKGYFSYNYNPIEVLT